MTIGDDFAAKVEEIMESRAVLKNNLTFPNLNGKPVMIAFDEARALLNNNKNKSITYLRACRRAFASFGIKNLCPILTGLWTDTNAVMDELSGPVYRVPSIRDVPVPKDLYQPFWALPGWFKPSKEALDHSRSLSEPNLAVTETIEGMQDVKESEVLIDETDRMQVDLPNNEPLEERFESLLEKVLPKLNQRDGKWHINNDVMNDLYLLALRLYRFGRPLWRGFLKCLSESDNAVKTKQLLRIAQFKLPMELINADADKLKLIQKLAILDVRLCLSVNGSSIAASDMVSQYMSICYYIWPQRDHLVVGYPIEPAIASASSYWMKRMSYLSQLETLIEAFYEGLVSKGTRGELLSLLLLTWGYDLSLKSIECEDIMCMDIVPIPLKLFLTTTYGPKFIKELEKSVEQSAVRQSALDKLLKGYVHISQWIRLKDTISVDDAPLLFAVGAACCTQAYAQANDKLIPVRLQEGQYTYIIIEDKNRKVYDISNGYLNSSWTSVMGEAPSSPYLIIYHQLGSEEIKGTSNIHQQFMVTRSGSGEQENDCQFSIGVDGLSSENFNCLNVIGGHVMDHLLLLRDGNVQVDDHDLMRFSIKRQWEELTIPHQQLHYIVPSTRAVNS
jgi:hypothetical protein